MIRGGGGSLTVVMLSQQLAQGHYPLCCHPQHGASNWVRSRHVPSRALTSTTLISTSAVYIRADGGILYAIRILSRPPTPGTLSICGAII